jgi:DNA processing protein
MKQNNDERLILALAIVRIPCLRSEEKLLLWDLLDDEFSLSSLSLRDLESTVGRDLVRLSWAPDAYIEAALSDTRFLERSGCRFVAYDDLAYPLSLRETARPPFGLFVRGLAGDSAVGAFAAAEAVAMVGTRMPTGRGLDAAFSIAHDLSTAGITVVSGLARGIDAACHRGTLAGPSAGTAFPNSPALPTYAVLPCGLDRIYPPGNRALASAILEGGGLLISEYPPETEIHKYRFPERNRIIAGLSRACIVVEAPAKSGALITAEHALDEGRDVWVAADCLGGQRSAGIDRLAADGAPALSTAEELLRDWADARSETGEFQNAD